MRFFSKLTLFVLLVTLSYFLIQYRLMLNNDPFYWKAAGQAEYLVLGGSRALKGIFPHVVQEELDLEGRFLNFAFTGVLSPYGKKYVHAIERKLIGDPQRDGLFILSVNPGMIMDFTAAAVPREHAFRFYKLWNMNAHPNLEYVLRHPRKGPALLIEYAEHRRGKRKQNNRVFRDGSNGTYLPDDYVPPQREVVIRYPLEKSPVREQQLEQLIQLLAARGKVFLVRTPVSAQTLREEDEVYTEFNVRMEGLASPNENVWYFNYSSKGDNYRFSDGNHHLEGKSAEAFSRQLARAIKTQSR